MIDHISMPVKHLARSADFYEKVLAILGFAKLVSKAGTVGFGKKYPEFWLNERVDLEDARGHDGFHVCLRAPSIEVVDDFHDRAVGLGARSDGAPGYRPEYSANYYAAFVIDFDGNRVEVVTFT